MNFAISTHFSVYTNPICSGNIQLQSMDRSLDDEELPIVGSEGKRCSVVRSLLRSVKRGGIVVFHEVDLPGPESSAHRTRRHCWAANGNNRDVEYDSFFFTLEQTSLVTDIERA